MGPKVREQLFIFFVTMAIAGMCCGAIWAIFQI